MVDKPRRVLGEWREEFVNYKPYALFNNSQDPRNSGAV